jgi:HrpA-like RNA helicase
LVQIRRPLDTFFFLHSSPCRSARPAGGAAAAAAAAAQLPKNVNPYTLREYSQRYWDIFEQRKKLPVMEHRDKFMDIMKSSQCMVLVGETGSGKTTQVGFYGSEKFA